MKHLYIILFVLPLIGFGQGLTFQLGSTCIVPFKTDNLIGNDFFSMEQLNELGFVDETTSQIGVQGSLTYDFNFQEISDKFFLSPNLTYTLINLNIYQKTGPIVNDFNRNHHLIQLSFHSSYQVHEKFTPSLGISLDGQLFSRLKGIIYDNSTTTSYNEYFGLDEPVFLISEEEIKQKDNEFILLGFSGKFSIEFQINNQFSIYSGFSFPLKTFKDEGSYIGDGGQVRSIGYTVPRTHISLGLGFSL